MEKNEDQQKDIIDKDLYEELDEEELREILEEERRKTAEKRKREAEEPKRPFPKWSFWAIAAAMVISLVPMLPQTISIPAVEFLMTSARLSADEDIQVYKEAVVVIEAGDGRGTGFAVSPDGTIITNHHVIEGESNIFVAYPEQGLFDAEVTAAYPEVDLAVLQVEGEDLPHLELAEQTVFEPGEDIYFIGNPLRFQGIANQGEVIGYTRLDDWEEPVLMLDAPVYRGNSGSPVINEEGKVIAVVFATLRHEEEGRVGLAIPIDYYHARQKE